MSVLPGGDWQVTPVVPDDSGSGPTPPLTLCGVLPFIVALAASAGVATTAAACDHQHASPVVWDAPNPDNTSAASNIRANRSANAGSVLAAGTGITQFGSDTTGVAIGAQGDYSSILGGDAGGIDSASSYAAIVAGTGATVTSSPRAFIGAGQSCVSTNSASAFLGAGSGGLVSAASDSFLGAGRNNIVRNNPRSAVVAGDANVVEGANSFVGAGFTNRVSGSGGGVLAGRNAIIDTSCDNSVVAGGNTNTITSNSLNSFVGAGTNHFIRANTSGIVAGTSNVVDTTCFSSVIGAGSANQITTYEGVSATYAAIGAGRSNVVKGTANDSGVFVGFTNVITNGARSAIAAGANNAITADRAFVGAGSQNSAQAADSAITNGLLNSTKGQYACVAGGATNLASNNSTFIGGGTDNTASGGQSCVVGGTGNSAAGKESAVIGGSGSIVSSQYGGVFAGDGATIEAACTGAVIAGGSGNQIKDDPAPGTKISARSLYAVIQGSNSASITGSDNAFVSGAVSATITKSPASVIVGTSTFDGLVGGCSITGNGIAADFSKLNFCNTIVGSYLSCKVEGDFTFCAGIYSCRNTTIGLAGQTLNSTISSAIAAVDCSMKYVSTGCLMSGSAHIMGDFAISSTLSSCALGGQSNRLGTVTSGVTSCATLGGNTLAIQAGATNSVAVGGASNTITGATNAGSFAGASHAIASTATRAVVLGGSTNTTSAPDSAILGGLTGTIEAACTGAVIAGGSGVAIRDIAVPAGTSFSRSLNAMAGGNGALVRGSDNGIALGGNATVDGSPGSVCFGGLAAVGGNSIVGPGVIPGVRVSYNNGIFNGGQNSIKGDTTTFNVIVGGQTNVIGVTANTDTCSGNFIAASNSGVIERSTFSAIVGGASGKIGSSTAGTTGVNSVCLGGSGNLLGTVTSGVTSCATLGGNTLAIQAGATNSVAVGGASNTITGATNAAVVGGASHAIASTATRAVVLGGSTNTTSAPDSAILGGLTGTIEAACTAAVIAGGTGNQIKDDPTPGTKLLARSAESAVIGGNTSVITGAGDSAILCASGSSITGSPGSIILGGGTLAGLVTGNSITSSGIPASRAQNPYGNIIGGCTNTSISGDTAISNVALGSANCVIGTVGNPTLVVSRNVILGGISCVAKNTSTSLIGGSSNTVGADANTITFRCAIVAGTANLIGTVTAGCTDCVILNGNGNAIQNAAVNCSITGGASNLVTNCTSAHIGGGTSNTITTTATNAVICGGLSNTITTALSSIIGAGTNNAIASGATAAGILAGIGASATMQTQVVRSGGYTASVGERQAYTLVLRGDTPGSVAAESVILKFGVAGGAPTQEITLVNGKSYTIRAEVNATQSGAANTSAAWFIQAIAYCTGGVVTVAASSTTNLPAALPGGLLGATIAFSGSGTTLRLTATIAGGTTLASKWTADVKVVETLA